MGKIMDFEPNKDGIFESLERMEEESHQNMPQHIHGLLVTTKEELQKNFLKMGAYLKVIHDNSLYIELDSITWQDYLDTPEIDLSRSQAYKLMAVYERWIEKYGYSPDEICKISIEKLYIASSQANKETADEWLEKAKTLSRADLKASTPGNKQKGRIVVCPHCGKEFELQYEKPLD